MSKLLILCLSALAIIGCQSTKPPMPKGKWVNANIVGFIPPNVAKYNDDTPTLSPSQGQSIPTVQKFPVAIEKSASAVRVTLVKQKEQDSQK